MAASAFLCWFVLSRLTILRFDLNHHKREFCCGSHTKVCALELTLWRSDLNHHRRRAGDHGPSQLFEARHNIFRRPLSGHKEAIQGGSSLQMKKVSSFHLDSFKNPCLKHFGMTPVSNHYRIPLSWSMPAD